MAESASRGGRSLDKEGSSSLASTSGGKGGGITAASDLGAERSLAGERDERGLEAMEELHIGEGGEEENDEEEYEDWKPLMHRGLKERTVALLGVVEMLEVDAMAAARRADAESGFGGGGGSGRAGPAVEAIMRARLKALTEARLSKKAIRFVEEEYPKEGVKLNNEAALQVVEMFINTRGVGLAEAFTKTCKETHGLPPDRRILGAILNARARRGVAWSHEIPHVKRVLDTLEQHKIKPHENELRFVRQLVDQGKFNHSWLPVDPEAIAKKMRLEVKKSKPSSKAFFKVVSKVKNAKYMIGSGRGKSRLE